MLNCSVKLNVKLCDIVKCLVVLILQVSACMTSQLQYIGVKPVMNRRLNATPLDVKTHSSALHCMTLCHVTSWCVSVNLATVSRTCQLLSVEVSEVTSLQLANGWRYMRKCLIFYQI